jgi:hypothetical protein
MTLKEEIDSTVGSFAENKANKMKGKFSSLLKKAAKKGIYNTAPPNIETDVIDTFRKYHLTEAVPATKKNKKPSKAASSDHSLEELFRR